MVDNDNDDTPKGESTRDCDCQDEDYVMERESPQLFSQSDLNDLVQDLSLSEESTEILASKLREKNLLLPGTRISFYRTRESISCNNLTIKDALCTATISQTF